MTTLFIYIGVILLASFIVWKGGGMLESSAEALSYHYNLSPIAHGSVITAVGSSFPELSTTVISTLIHGQFDLGVSAIVGSAIFNILVIPGLSAILSKKMETNWNFVVKDVQYYITSLVMLLLVFALAVIYNPIGDQSFTGEMTRPLAVLPIAFYFLYLYLQKQETKIYQNDKEEGKKEDKNIKKEWGKFFLSLILIVGSVEGLVRAAIFLGDYFNTASFVWGVLVLATATSVPDAIISIREAIHDKGMVSLANVIGSNIFDLLIAVPLGVLIAGSSSLNFKVAAPMMLFLGAATILLMFFLLRNQILTRKEGWWLLIIYAMFIVWIGLESFNVINWIG